MQIVAHRLFYPTSGQPHSMSLIKFFTRGFTSSKARRLLVSSIISVFVKSFVLKDCEEHVSIYKQWRYLNDKPQDLYVSR